MGTRALTWTINYPNGEPWAGGVVTVELMQGFTTAEEVYPATTVTFTSDADGTNPAGSALAVPDTGTAHYKITKPNEKSFRVYLAAGGPVDLVELETIAGSSVDQDDLQTLLDEAQRFSITNVTAEYTVLATDQYLYCTMSPTPIHLPECVLGVTTPLMIDNGASVNITVDGYGAETINGAETLIIYPGECRALRPIADGTWRA